MSSVNRKQAVEKTVLLPTDELSRYPFPTSKTHGTQKQIEVVETPWPFPTGPRPGDVAAAKPGVSQLKVAQASEVLDAKVDERIVTAINSLGFKLQALATEPNTVVSGASVALFLAMMTQGATEEQATKLVASLGLGSMSPKQFTAGLRALAAQLSQSTGGVTYAIASSVWADKRFTMDAHFVKGVKDEFAAEARVTQLSGAADEINGWVEKQTAGLIKDFVSAGELSDAFFVALSALYFKAPWKTEFSAADTRKMAFAKEDGSEVTVPVMYAADVKGQQAGGYRHDFTAAKLPYGKDGSTSMVVIVPKAEKGNTTAKVVEQLATAEGQKELLGSFRPMTGDVYLPKFEVESEHDLVAGLGKLNIPGAGPYALVGDRGVAFDIMKQKAKIIVNEQGTEAAAVTGGVALESMRMPLLEATRPFVYAIVDEKSQTVVFSGVYSG